MKRIRRTPSTPIEQARPEVYDGSWSVEPSHAPEPDPFADLWQDETASPVDTLSPLAPTVLRHGRARRALHRGFNWLDEAAQDVINRRPGYGRKAMALGAISLTQLAIAGGIGYGVVDAVADAPRPAAHGEPPINHEPHQPTATVALERAKTPVTEEQKLYESSSVIARSTPFEANFLNPDQRAELNRRRTDLANRNLDLETVLSERRKAEALYGPGEYDEKIAEEHVKTVLERMQAEFKTAVQLSSGIRVNIYSSRLDDKTEPWSIDIKALDVLVTKVLELSQNIEGSPVNEQVAQLQKLASEGKLSLRLSMVLVSDERICLNAERSLISRDTPATSTTTTCKAVGFNSRVSIGYPTNNQVVVALDSGSESAQDRDYFSPEVRALKEVLTPDETTTKHMAHEIAHALFAATDQVRKYDGGEVEHHKFVNVVESRIFALLANLGHKPGRLADQTAAAFVTAFHVE